MRFCRKVRLQFLALFGLKLFFFIYDWHAHNRKSSKLDDLIIVLLDRILGPQAILSNSLADSEL